MDESTLKQLADVVNYELDQMRASAARLAALAEERGNFDRFTSQHQWERGYEITVETNAFLESFLVHFRNLQDFLSPRKSVKPLAELQEAFPDRARWFR